MLPVRITEIFLLITYTVSAILIFGDVRHVANVSYGVLGGTIYDSGSSTRDAEGAALMDRYAGIMRSYCDTQDPICATSSGGPYVNEQHWDYFETFSDDAAGWVKSIL